MREPTAEDLETAAEFEIALTLDQYAWQERCRADRAERFANWEAGFGYRLDDETAICYGRRLA